MTASVEATAHARLAAEAAADKKAHDIVVIDVSDVLVLTDVFVLCTAANEPQIDAIVDEVAHRLSRAGAGKPRREGERRDHWQLLDFGDVVVHVMHREQRTEYALERLWKDCPQIDVTDVVEPTTAGPPRS